MYKIYIVEDDATIARTLKEHLETSDIELVRLLLEQVRLDKKRES